MPEIFANEENKSIISFNYRPVFRSNYIHDGLEIVPTMVGTMLAHTTNISMAYS